MEHLMVAGSAPASVARHLFGVFPVPATSGNLCIYLVNRGWRSVRTAALFQSKRFNNIKTTTMIKYKTKEAALAAAEVQRVRISDWLGGHAQQERKVSVSVSDNDTFITLSVSSSTESPCGTSHQVARMMVDYIASHDDAPQEWSMWANNGRVMSISNHYYFESDEKVSA